MLIYDETPLRTNSSLVADLDGTAMFLTHFKNSLMLKFFLANGTVQEKAQASREMVICERKMKYWRNHPRYIQEMAATGAEKIKAEWQK